MRNILLAVVFIAISGCATTPLPTSEARQVPAERVLRPESLKPIPGFGAITVKRDVGAMVWVCSTTISVDAEPVAIVDAGEKLTVYLTPGRHIIAASTSFGCGGDVVEEKIDSIPEVQQTFRTGFGSNKGIFLKPTAL